MKFAIDQEADGGPTEELGGGSGAMVYGKSLADALLRAEALALRVITDRLALDDAPLVEVAPVGA